MIVGRDTKSLTEEGIAKAAVETVAENTSDGVTAPLMFLMLGGAPLGFLYKAVNTMDSMLGYKNEKISISGEWRQRWMTCLYLPSRVSAVLMIAAAFLTGMDAKRQRRFIKETGESMPVRILRRRNQSVQGRFRCSWQEMHGIWCTA